MAEELSWAAVPAWRVARQGLAERTAAEDWMDVVRRVCGLHAQAQTSAELTLWARGDGLSAGAVADAPWTNRSLVRTWAMRAGGPGFAWSGRAECGYRTGRAPMPRLAVGCVE